MQVAANTGSEISSRAPSAAVRASWMRSELAWIWSVFSLSIRPDMPLGEVMPTRLSIW